MHYNLVSLSYFIEHKSLQTTECFQHIILQQWILHSLIHILVLLMIRCTWQWIVWWLMEIFWWKTFAVSCGTGVWLSTTINRNWVWTGAQEKCLLCKGWLKPTTTIIYIYFGPALDCVCFAVLYASRMYWGKVAKSCSGDSR